jgi:hypothetical protein
MNSTSRNASARNSISGAAAETAASPAETTLRLIAGLPAPNALEDRVLAGLRTAPRTARILRWPAMLQPTGSWMRVAAAAAIVFVVAGGGWGIYTRVQPSQPAAKVIVMPRAGAAGGFSSAGAMRTPQTLNGPLLSQPAGARQTAVKPLGQVKPLAQVTQLKKAPVVSRTGAQLKPLPAN